MIAPTVLSRISGRIRFDAILISLVAGVVISLFLETFQVQVLTSGGTIRSYGPGLTESKYGLPFPWLVKSREVICESDFCSILTGVRYDVASYLLSMLLFSGTMYILTLGVLWLIGRLGVMAHFRRPL